ncbi:SMP-30/gluconolactonase/LRE family protein [Marinobacter bryozoorum]|uniref:SMP-30/gluconolactonase/LRE family protein n=1 Tax=Marinobacter bryozoorum TaxID=256324 RepID=UPI0020035877|nr:SMP-30/gluconolactonase/LRE family protein [Marinobacter bryozoorum]MCK7544534.1 SMP-30/gluconolactonase/LRE family protein [Marinobacter bryozoorum]
MKWLLILLLIVFVVLGGFLLSPSPIDSRVWQAPSAPSMQGPLAPNERLRLSDLLARGQLEQPEDTAMDAGGRIYTGTADGWIVRLEEGGEPRRWKETGGRPLGLDFDRQGNLIVADAERGLLSISPQGDLRVLSREAEGLPFRLADGVDVGPDGNIYFTDASTRHRLADHQLDLLAMRPNGRLLRYSPRTGETTVLLRNLYFANGVVASPDGDFLLVAETPRYRILRYWLTGPERGRAEVFADNLPGFPDNLDVDDAGRYWVAMPALRRPSLDFLHRHAWLKNLVARLPPWLRPGPGEYGLVVALNSDGGIVTSVQDTRGDYLWGLTSARVHGDDLYFGSLYTDRLGRLPLKAIPGMGEGNEPRPADR